MLEDEIKDLKRRVERLERTIKQLALEDGVERAQEDAERLLDEITGEELSRRILAARGGFDE